MFPAQGKTAVSTGVRWLVVCLVRDNIAVPFWNVERRRAPRVISGKQSKTSPCKVGTSNGRRRSLGSGSKTPRNGGLNPLESQSSSRKDVRTARMPVDYQRELCGDVIGWGKVHTLKGLEVTPPAGMDNRKVAGRTAETLDTCFRFARRRTNLYPRIEVHVCEPLRASIVASYT